MLNRRMPGSIAVELLDHRQRQVVAAAHPEAERVLARLLHRLHHAHEMRGRAAEAAAALRLHLVEQAGAEVEAELAGHAAAVGQQREEVADAAGEVRRRVDEDAVVGLEAQRLGDVAGVARDGPQRLADALGQAGGAGREHDHRLLVLVHGASQGSATVGGRSSFAAGRAHAVDEAVRVRGHDQAHRTAVRRRAGVVVRQHDDVRLRLADQPVHVVLRQAGVERDHDLAGEPGAQHADEELVVLLEHQRDAGAAAAGGGQQGRRDARRPRLHVRVRVGAAARAQQRRVRALGRPAAQARDGVGHQRFGGHGGLAGCGQKPTYLNSVSLLPTSTATVIARNSRNQRNVCRLSPRP